MANPLPEKGGDAGFGGPEHIAIIMDGNGRWAKRRMLPRKMGHRKGADAVKRAVKGCIEQGVSCLTLFAFSSENWSRPADEVNDLMSLLRDYLSSELDELDGKGVRLRVIGDRSTLSADIVSDLELAEARTRENAKLTLVIALSYGARAEIVEAARALAAQAVSGELDPALINEETLAAHLQTRDIPDPDLIIRTSGEQRLSNFLLWQAAYAEFLFLDVLWPDFSEKDIAGAVEDFRSRERRYGGRPELKTAG